MPLLEFQTHYFRNLVSERHQFSPKINLIYGDNGSGKSSILEAIHYLSAGRSFRTHKHETVVTHGHPAMSIFGRVSEPAATSSAFDSAGNGLSPRLHKLGISRDVQAKRTALRLDGDKVRNLSALAKYLPVTVIEPGSFDIIAGGPGRRRQFLDWVVFHVEHSFSEQWQRCQKIISQRNRLLRSGRIDARLLRAWNREYLGVAEEVTHLRERWFQRLVPHIHGYVAELGIEWGTDLTLDFFRGWDRQRSLAEVLERQTENEQKAGHTLYGPNRCDLRIKVGHKPAAEVLSRGQQKTLVVLLKLAQGQLLLRERHMSCGFLLDDINAELDTRHQDLLAQQLFQLGSQVFVTSIARPEPDKLWPGAMADLSMFHVEHGTLRLET